MVPRRVRDSAHGVKRFSCTDVSGIAMIVLLAGIDRLLIYNIGNRSLPVIGPRRGECRYVKGKRLESYGDLGMQG